MKSTIDSLRKAYRTAQEQAAARAEEIRQQEETLAGLKAEQEKAAADGDLEAYEAKGTEIRRAEGLLYVLIKSADAAGRITPEMAREAWTEYAEGFEKTQSEKLAAYAKKRRELCRDYEKLIDEQNAALNAREELAAMAGTDAGSYDLSAWIPLFGEENTPRSISGKAPDAEFFTKACLWPCHFDLPNAPGLPHWTGLETANKVICLREAVPRPDFGHK